MTTPPFATAADLASRLGRTFTSEEAAQADVLLADASDYLRDIIGWQVYPPAVVTLGVQAAPGVRLDLPGRPIIAVTAVAASNAGFGQAPTAVPGFYLFNDGVQVDAGFGPGRITVTYQVGYAEAPGTLRAWACVLVAQATSNLTELGTLGVGRQTSTAIDDYRTNFTPSEDPSPFSLPDRVIEQLRSTFGSSVFVTGS